jgi:hypothetical protein
VLEVFGQLANQFGLAFALLAFGVLALVKALDLVLKGDRVVPRWVFDREVEAHQKTYNILLRAAGGLETGNNALREVARKVIKPVRP